MYIIRVYLVSGLGFVLIPLDMSYIYLVYLDMDFIRLVACAVVILVLVEIIWLGCVQKKDLLVRGLLVCIWVYS
jgi:hypothetical protein